MPAQKSSKRLGSRLRTALGFGAAAGIATVTNVGPTTTSGVILASGVSALLGWSISETTGSAGAKVVIWDNPSAATGKHYGRPVNLVANESVRDWFAGAAPQCVTGGLYLQVLSGSVDVTVFTV